MQINILGKRIPLVKEELPRANKIPIFLFCRQIQNLHILDKSYVS